MPVCGCKWVGQLKAILPNLTKNYKGKNMKKNNRKRVLVRGKRTNAEKKMINITRLSQKTNEEKTVFVRTIYPVLSNLDIEVLATEAVMVVKLGISTTILYL